VLAEWPDERVYSGDIMTWYQLRQGQTECLTKSGQEPNFSRISWQCRYVFPCS